MFQTNGGTLVQMGSPFATAPVTTQTANDAYWQVVNHAGNWWWNRDAIDSRVFGNVLNNTNAPGGIGAAAPDATELNGVLTAPMTTRPGGYDTDNDGMPNDWEQRHGLNPSSSAVAPDWKLDFDNDGYINLLEYINEAGEFPAGVPIVFNGATNTRYAQITNWKTNDGGITAGSNWQPSKFDEARINNGTAVVDAVGQHAGLLVVGANPGDTATLNITAGWLHAADSVVIGGDDAATATVNLSGGTLKAPALAKGAGGTFNFTGGTLQSTIVGFDLENEGGTLAPGQSIGNLHVMGDLTLSSGSLEIELGSSVLSDRLLVNGAADLGGSLNVVPLAGFTPVDGNGWPILSAGSINGQFSSISPGYSVQQQGDVLMLYFGEAPPLEQPGDENGDGIVDAADYVAWRKLDGSPGEYDEWKHNFGSGSGSGSGGSNAAATPEPTAIFLLVVAAMAAGTGQYRRLRNFGRFLQE
jgi:hypothetical protein